MDEFGETPAYYIWPKGHDEGQPFPPDFYERISNALDAIGMDFERV